MTGSEVSPGTVNRYQEVYDDHLAEGWLIGAKRAFVNFMGRALAVSKMDIERIIDGADRDRIIEWMRQIVNANEVSN